MSANQVTVYHGEPGHFCGSAQCCFHLHTTVRGKWRVSTVGCYHPISSRRPDGSLGPPEPVGYKRLFETMVFPITRGGRCTYQEVEMVPANTAPEAEKAHAAMVAKYSRLRKGAVIR